MGICLAFTKRQPVCRQRLFLEWSLCGFFRLFLEWTLIWTQVQCVLKKLGGNYGLASFYPGVTIVRGKNGLPHRVQVHDCLLHCLVSHCLAYLLEAVVSMLGLKVGLLLNFCNLFGIVHSASREWCWCILNCACSGWEVLGSSMYLLWSERRSLCVGSALPFSNIWTQIWISEVCG